VTTSIGETDFLSRLLPLKGTFNVRDVGGYRTTDGRQVKWKTLLRGDALHSLDDESRMHLASYGLQSSIDLREDDEREAAPDRFDGEVRSISVPLFSLGASTVMGETLDHTSLTTLEDVYRLLVRTRGSAIATAIRQLADPANVPAIVHCSAGKDRTGVVIALVLAVIGVPDEVIAADFAATGLFLNEEFRQALLARSESLRRDSTVVERMLSCEPALILGILEEIRSEYGDIDVYLVQHGLELAELRSLRTVLLSQPGAADVPADPTTIRGSNNE
jgi:protein-tyrosine phosphatase